MNPRISLQLTIAFLMVVGILVLTQIGLARQEVEIHREHLPDLEQPTQVPTTEPKGDSKFSFDDLIQASPGGKLDLEIAPDDWVFVEQGIDFRVYRVQNPLNIVYVARMDINNLELTVESSIGQGRLSGGTETVSGMANRYDQAVNYWGQSWGSRNRVVVAINGGFYDGNGIPHRGQVHSGWYSKRHSNFQNGSGFAWKMDRTPFIGECVNNKPSDQIIKFDPDLPNSPSQKIDDVNRDRLDDELILYTPQYDTDTGTNDDPQAVEVLVEMDRPTLILPPANATAKGYVRQIRNGKGSTVIPFDHIVLSAHGVEKNALLSNINVGDKIGISQGIKHYLTDCVTRLSTDWTKTYASVGGDDYFLKNGAIYMASDPNRQPRTAIAFYHTPNNPDPDYLYFIVVDGRYSGISIGMTMTELATFVRDTLGATHGVAQDGGGSSTMVINGVVVNNTFCNQFGCEVKYQVFLPVVLNDAGNESVPASYPEAVAASERPVANGMMMVMVEPADFDTTYAVNTNVVTNKSTQVRLGPGTNYGVMATKAAGTTGVILDHDLSGVLAKGSYWWKVDFSGTVGWVKEDSISSLP